MAANSQNLQSLHTVALDLHQILKELEPAQWRRDFADRHRARLNEILAEVEFLLERGVEMSFAESVDELASRLQNRLPADDVRRQWMTLRKELTETYGALSEALRASHLETPQLRPTNYSRSFFHVLMGFIALALVTYLPFDILTYVAGGFAVAAWTMEISRRRSEKINAFLMQVFSAVSHPHEQYRVNSSTWYASALFLLVLTQSQIACAAAVIVLGLADPAAGTIGRRFGRTKLLNGRSLEGTLTFFVVGGIAAFGATFLLFTDQITTFQHLICALVAGAVGAVVELVSKRVDDNFSIPVGVAAAVWLTLSLF